MSGVRLLGILVALLFVCSSLAVAEPQEKPAIPSTYPALDWLRDYLAEFSMVDFPSSGVGGREVVTTRTEGLISADTFVLAYERVIYTKAVVAQVDHRQVIMYTVQPASLDPGSVSVRREGSIALGEQPQFWMVTIAAGEDPGFIPYDNLFESRKDDGTPDLTRSRGRVREIVLGYFGNEESASGLARRFREYLASLPEKTAPPAPALAPAVKGPGQSGA